MVFYFRGTVVCQIIAIAFSLMRKLKNNLISIAATYDKMEPEPAGIILASISQARDGSSDDAVKILHYMGDRTKGELLAGLAGSEPELAAYFCKKLKQIVVE